MKILASILLSIFLITQSYAAVVYNSKDGSVSSEIDVQESSEKGQANGYAGLDENGKVPSAQLPAGSGSPCDAFPVGAIFISTVSTNPGTSLGCGTWSAFGAGRVLAGLDSGQTEFDTVEETGGAKTHTLTESEIPSHTHVQNSHNHTQDAHSHVYPSQTNANGSATSYEHGTLDTSSAEAEATETTNTTVATNQAATATNQNTGGGGAHNNLQPYIVVYMFKRTA